MKYGADFKKQDGKWKIWHLHVYGLFATAYDKSWAAKECKAPATTAALSADKAPTTNWEFCKDTKYVPLEPEPPQPYETWNDSIVPAPYGLAK